MAKITSLAKLHGGAFIGVPYNMITVGIDATNLGSGGAQTHLRELLCALKPRAYGVQRVVIWGPEKTLSRLDDQPFLVKRSPRALNRKLLHRSCWQLLSLTKEAFLENVDVLFVPGGWYFGRFHPVVTMSQNLLPFDWREIKRYGIKMSTLKFVLLRAMHGFSFRRSDGVIFLSEYARDAVQEAIGKIDTDVIVVPHGLGSRFKKRPRIQAPISSYSPESPYKIIYVSTVNEYKHQWLVIEAVNWLRSKLDWPIQLDLIGSAVPRSLRCLNVAMEKWDPDNSWVKYHGPLPYDQLHDFYHRADLGVFASSCENLPNILIETMAAGLPVASSIRGPMPEVLKDGGLYFDPENPSDISDALRRLIENPKLRGQKAARSYELSDGYDWEKCSESTFRFLARVSVSSD